MRTQFPNPTAVWTADDARVVLDEWRRSGESVAAFARKHGLSAPRLYWWKKQLTSRQADQALSLVPATIVTRTREASIAIRLPGNVTIDVTSASPSWVAAIVAELARLP